MTGWLVGPAIAAGLFGALCCFWIAFAAQPPLSVAWLAFGLLALSGALLCVGYVVTPGREVLLFMGALFMFTIASIVFLLIRYGQHNGHLS